MPTQALAAEYAACWVSLETDPWSGQKKTTTRCRISGGDVVDFADDDAIPIHLYPNIGTDLLGDCWYRTSAETNYQIVPINPDGGAELVLIVDDAPGASGYFRRCTSEPAETIDPSAEAWEYVMSYVHPPPAPDVNPAPGDGVTGLETFVGVPVPDVHDTQLASGTGATIDIHIEVSAVEVDWGDSRVDTFPADLVVLAGYPGGGARHVYEVKELTGYDLSISYLWTARWRIAAEDWELLDVPETTTSLLYPVAEIVSVITE
ncbi:MAG: hypothetical protein ACRDXF_11755 [Acidimicrobiia bacterium]